MPRYFMNVQQGDTLIADPEGETLPGLDDVRQMVIASAREIMSEKILRGVAPDGDKFIVADEDGRVVLVVPFRDAIG